MDKELIPKWFAQHHREGEQGHGIWDPEQLTTNSVIFPYNVMPLEGKKGFSPAGMAFLPRNFTAIMSLVTTGHKPCSDSPSNLLFFSLRTYSGHYLPDHMLIYIKCCGYTFVLARFVEGNLHTYNIQMVSNIWGTVLSSVFTHYIPTFYIFSMQLFSVHSDDLLKWLLSGFKIICSQDFSSKPLHKSRKWSC